MKLVLRLLALVAMVYVGLVIVVALKQRSLIYLPSRIATPELFRLAAEHRFQPWTNAAGERIGWWRPRQIQEGTGTVLILHGNAGTAVGREYLADPVQESLPLDVFILEYPGYADRDGTPSEASLCDEAAKSFDLLASRPGPLFLIGESLGSGVAAFLAGRKPDRVDGVCLLVPFNNLAAAAASHYPWLPVGLLLRDRFPSDRHLQRYQGPLAVLTAGRDSVVPPELGRALFEGYQGGRKHLWDFPEQDHWDAINQPESTWREVSEFWEGKSAAASP